MHFLDKYYSINAIYFYRVLNHENIIEVNKPAYGGLFQPLLVLSGR